MYARCKIKNIGIKIKHPELCPDPVHYIEVIDKLPSDCIRLHTSNGWCLVHCHECKEL